MPELKVACLLLCAGKSSRMSPDHKLLLKINKLSVIQKTAEEINKADFCEVIAVTGYQKDLVQREIEKFPFKIIHNEQFDMGLHSSIKAGVLQLNPEADFFAVCLADQPALTKDDYNFLISAVKKLGMDKKIFSPMFKGTRGNPTVISKKMISDILAHSDDDRGCFYLFQRYPEAVMNIEMINDSALLDIDTPELYRDFIISLN
jgi:molybdenum cofactor cytidylyltransferase